MDEHSSIKHRVAWTLVAEIGPDVLSFPSPAHIASWVGVCPGNHESAGKRAKASAVWRLRSNRLLGNISKLLILRRAILPIALLTSIFMPRC